MQATKAAAPSPATSSSVAITSSVDIVDWRPEEDAFWK